MPVAEVPARVHAAWRTISRWYAANSARQHRALRAGVPAGQLAAFERQTGLTLPADYRASLATHNGEVALHDYTYLNLAGVLNSWASMNKLAVAGTFAHAAVYEQGAGIIRNTWWHRGWIPFAEDSGGNMLCLDTAPAAQGVGGQVLRMEMGAGPGIMEYPSFLSWLEGYCADLAVVSTL